MGEACIVVMRQIVQSSCALAMWGDALVWNGDEWRLFIPTVCYLAKFHLQVSVIKTQGHVTTEMCTTTGLANYQMTGHASQQQ